MKNIRLYTLLTLQIIAFYGLLNPKKYGQT